MERITSYGFEYSTFRENWKGEDLFERQLVSQKTLTHKETLTKVIDHKYNKSGKFVHLDNVGENVYNHKSDKKNFSKNAMVRKHKRVCEGKKQNKESSLD